MMRLPAQFGGSGAIGPVIIDEQHILRRKAKALGRNLVDRGMRFSDFFDSLDHNIPEKIKHGASRAELRPEFLAKIGQGKQRHPARR